MPQMLGTRYFIKSQGFTIDESVMFQDNLSAMLIDRNSMASSSKRTKHTRVRYYLIKDFISTGEIFPPGKC